MGGKTEIVQQAPTPAPTAGQSAAEYAAALPQILKTQLQYQPQFDQAQLDSFRELAPQYASLTQQVGEEFAPEQYALGEILAKQANEMSQNGLSQNEIDFYRDQFNSQIGNQAGSGLGSDFLAKNLLQQNLAQKQYGQNLGLSLSGKVPLSQAYQPASNFNVGGGFLPAFQSQLGAYGSVYSGAGRPQAIQSPDYLGGIGGALQGIGSIATGGGFGALF